MAQHKRTLQSAFAQQAEQLNLAQEAALKAITETLGDNNPTPPNADEKLLKLWKHKKE